ncbi:Type-2Aa cytolytic delta-endotoxin [Streptomyces sp. Ag109_G2-15]|uniref:Type-2Aa cytolytic delta-endotoxin n=1 Tax=Streptomyces sp. Ag109_G2-15 TaxID=1938850 RepID=UPI000BC65051|nr:Type-2Aa cytolytic delta-endotoxin [Streptomyces sp. Ag109_G2-15]SOE06611.1 toxin [Streptomyces sp. Ag109_G2-15]
MVFSGGWICAAACRTGALRVAVAHRYGILTPHQCNKMFKEGKLAACFRTFTAVGEAHLVQAEALGRAFQEAIAPATVNYDFGHIRDAAAVLPDSDIVKMVRGWGLQEEAPILVMALSLKEAVRQALPPEAAQAPFWDTVERDLMDAFTGLGAQEGEPGLVYYEEGPDHTSYYRDLFFALQDEEAGAYVYAVAFCTDVTVGFGKSRVGTLGLTDTAPFAVRLNAIVVRQKLANVA